MKHLARLAIATVYAWLIYVYGVVRATVLG